MRGGVSLLGPQARQRGDAHERLARPRGRVDLGVDGHDAVDDVARAIDLRDARLATICDLLAAGHDQLEHPVLHAHVRVVRDRRRVIRGGRLCAGLIAVGDVQPVLAEPVRARRGARERGGREVRDEAVPEVRVALCLDVVAARA